MTFLTVLREWVDWIRLFRALGFLGWVFLRALPWAGVGAPFQGWGRGRGAVNLFNLSGVTGFPPPRE